MKDRHRELLTPENAAMLLIDHQTGTLANNQAGYHSAPKEG